MNKICIIDTSILLEILKVVYCHSEHEDVFSQLTDKIENSEKLFIPFATIMETGNHIAQNGNGQQKRKSAIDFIAFLNDTRLSQTPFSFTTFPREENLMSWFESFPDNAMKGTSLSDTSIISEWEMIKARFRTAEVYIWSKDTHLQGYSSSNEI